MRLILLPGLDGTGDLTVQLGACLGRSCDVEIVSYPTALYRYEDIASWFAPQLGTGDYVIVAESFSGPLAIQIAATAPQGLKALVLVASFARSPRRLPGFLAGLLYGLPLQSTWFLRLSRWLLVGKWGRMSFPEDFLTTLRKVPRQTLVGRLRAVARVDASAEMMQLSIPRLLVAASADRLVPPVQNDLFAKSGWTVVSIDGPHFLALTRAEEVAGQIRGFLEGHR